MKQKKGVQSCNLGGSSGKVEEVEEEEEEEEEEERKSKPIRAARVG